jgi:hypothetical protein
MIIFGSFFEKNPPKKINSIYGYRTTMSMKNADTWEFAHKYSGKLWKKIGFITIIVSIILTFLSFTLNENVQGGMTGLLVMVQTVILVASIFPVEKELKKNFDQNGNRRINGVMANQEQNSEIVTNPKILIFSLLFTIITFCVIGVFLVTGDVVVHVNEKEMEIVGSYWSDKSISYDEIKSISLMDDLQIGRKSNGMNTFKLNEGHFKNEQYGKYLLYAYVNCKSYIVMETDTGIVVINAKDSLETKKLYDEIEKKIKE